MKDQRLNWDLQQGFTKIQTIRTIQVLHCIPSMQNQAAGTVACVRRISESTSGLGVRSLVLATSTDNDRDVQVGSEMRFRIGESVPIAPRRLKPSRDLRIALSEFARSSQETVAHVHGLWLLPNIYPGWYFGKGKRRPLLISPHGMLNPGALEFSSYKKTIIWHLFQGAVVEGANCIHATSEAELDDLRRFGITSPIALIPNGVDIPDIVTSSTTSRKRTVLYLGRLHHKKGLDRLLEAWQKVESNNPDWNLLIVGPDENGYKQKLADLVQTLSLNSVSLHTGLYGTDRDRAMKEADVFVLPTRSENFALVVAECLAVGTPVICTKGAPWQGLEEHGSGWWIEHGVEPLAKSLQQAMTLEVETLNEMGRRGTEWMRKDFNWDKIGGQFVDVYKWLSGQASKPDFVDK